MPSCPFAMKDLTRTCEGGAFRVDADMMLVRQLEDDCVWKTVNLVSPVDFGVASFMAKEGLTSHGMSVRQVDLMGRVCDAWSMLIRCESLALDERMFNRYRDIFSSPSLALPNEERSEDEAIRAFLALWASDHLLAALCANHMLVHARIGMLAVFPSQVAELEQTIERGNAKRFLRDHGIELFPTGLTREELQRI